MSNLVPSVETSLPSTVPAILMFPPIVTLALAKVIAVLPPLLITEEAPSSKSCGTETPVAVVASLEILS